MMKILALLAAVVVGVSLGQERKSWPSPDADVAMCLDPRVPESQRSKFMHEFEAGHGRQRRAFTGSSWSQCRFSSCTLTWSIVPDGTDIENGQASSDLISWMDGIYGGQNTNNIRNKPWFSIFEEELNAWSAYSPITYQYVDDDGARWPGSGGSNSRGDIRIAAAFYDGNSGVLAYNYYPSNGDMLLDSGDNFYNVISGNSIRLRNVLAHEHGHGLGLSHSCPIQQVKLMEPFISLSFFRAQYDDIVGTQSLYGDRFEGSSAASFACDSSGEVFDAVSIHSGSDVDDFRFSVSGTSSVEITVTPIAPSAYPNGPQANNGDCTTSTTVNGISVSNLRVEFVSNGGTVLQTENSRGAGNSETLTRNNVPSGNYRARVRGSSFSQPTDIVQLYEVRISCSGGGSGPVCGDGTCNGDETRCDCAQDCGNPFASEAGRCNNNEDDDCDGDIDDQDSDCEVAGPVCGDGICNGDETRCDCSADCGSPQAERCGNGIDDDCDGDIDEDDSDCTPTCFARKERCTANNQCCSGRCRRVRSRRRRQRRQKKCK
eukprot:m.144245 g.144245  ORF g.144245 m.144245 type:complete len:544 (-) comp24244_c0_seq2:118-1749(-)